MLSAAENDHFIIYHPAQDLPPVFSLYERLVVLRKTGDRGAMKAEALLFTGGKEPYSGLYVPEVKALTPPIPQFDEAVRVLHIALRLGHPPAAKNACLQWALSVLPSLPEWIEAVGDSDCTLQIERVWQTIFARTILTNLHAQDNLPLFHIVAMHKLLLAFRGKKEHWHEFTLYDILHATVMLPAAVFPLPEN